MAFHDVRLPEQVERGATGGPRFNTTILPLVSGHEKRNINWLRARGAWNIGYGIDDETAFSAVLTFFYTREGQAHSFRFKDWSDYQLDRQVIGTTDGSTTTFQLFKRYTSGGINYDRPLTKPLASGGLAWVNGVSQVVSYDGTPATTEVDINPLTGVITLGATHAATNTLDVEIQTDFDVPVRFDTDEFGITLETFNAGAIPDLPIVEVRLD